jgi:tetratricopeptide (TPR) repeat protein
LRVAFEWIEADPEGSDKSLLLAGSMYGPAVARGRTGELRQILTAALARSDPAARTLGRARALTVAAYLGAMHGDLEKVTGLGEEAVEVYRELGEKRELAWALIGAARWGPNMEVSGRAMRESRALFEELGDKRGLAALLFFTGDAALERGEYDAARDRLTESLVLFRQLGEFPLPLVSLGRLACVDGDYALARALVEESLALRKRPPFNSPFMVAITLVSLGEIDRCEGDPARGAPWFEQAMAAGREIADDMIVGWSSHNLGHVALHSGDLVTAAAHFRESLLRRWRAGPGVDVAGGLAGMAGVAVRAGQLTEAARLLGAVDGMLESKHMALPPADELVRRADLAAVRAQLDGSAFEAAFREGRSAKFEDLEAMVNAVSLRVGDGGR